MPKSQATTRWRTAGTGVLLDRAYHGPCAPVGHAPRQIAKDVLGAMCPCAATLGTHEQVVLERPPMELTRCIY
jgi:hypothetical protein